MPKTIVHTVKKGENLDKIAKSYAIKSFKDIYEDPVNAKFRKTRKKPDLIQPGDKIIIPNFALTKDKRKSLSALISTIEARIKRQEASVKELQASTKALKSEINQGKSSFKKTQTAVDGAAMVLTILASLGKIVAKGAKMSTMSASEVSKANKEMLKEVGDMHLSAVEPALQAGAQTMSTKTNKAVAYSGILIDSFFNLTSPSFWGKTYMKAQDEGLFKKLALGKFGEGWDAWSKAVTWDPLKEFDKMSADMQAQSDKIIKSIQESISADQALLKQLKGVARR